MFSVFGLMKVKIFTRISGKKTYGKKNRLLTIVSMSNRRSPVLQGVRREVGKHAKTINMTLSKTRFHCNDDEDKSTNQPGKPSANIE